MRLFELAFSTAATVRLLRAAKFGLAAMLALACLSWTSPAEARGRGNAAGRYAMQMLKKEQAFFAKQMAAYQKQQKAQYEAFMKRFDTNGNGKIDGKEKGPAKKYLRELELGKNPDKMPIPSSTSSFDTSRSKAKAKAKSKSKK